jgi:hypothetical protein
MRSSLARERSGRFRNAENAVGAGSGETCCRSSGGADLTLAPGVSPFQLSRRRFGIGSCCPRSRCGSRCRARTAVGTTTIVATIVTPMATIRRLALENFPSMSEGSFDCTARQSCTQCENATASDCTYRGFMPSRRRVANRASSEHRRTIVTRTRAPAHA